MKVRWYIPVVVLLGLTIAMFHGCGGSSGSSGGSTTPNSTSSSVSYFGTQSPGDTWSWNITRDANGSGTFSATNNSTGKSYNGSVVTLSNRYLKLTITSTTDSNVVIAALVQLHMPLNFPTRP